MNHPQSDQAEANAQRAAWMRVLALAESSELDGAFGALGNLPAHHMLRPRNPAWPWCARAAAAPARVSTWAR